MSRHWAAEDGKTGWLKPDGSVVRIPPASLGVINNGHHIKMGRGGEPSVWDESFERVFDKADTGFPELIRWLEGLERRPVRDAADPRQRFIAQQCHDDKLVMMTECAVSLAVRGPRNREASVAIADHLRGSIESAERNALIGLNMRNSQRVIADSIGSRGKFVAVYSEEKEFIFGDGFFHNVANSQMAPHLPKLFVPITPRIYILLCRPSRYTVEPKLSTLVLEEHEVDLCNHAVQVYSKNAIYFCSQQPEPHEDFRRTAHMRYQDSGNPIDNIIHSIPGVPARDPSLDHLFAQKTAGIGGGPRLDIFSRLKQLFSNMV